MLSRSWAVGCVALLGCRQLLDLDDYDSIPKIEEPPTGCVEPAAPKTGDCTAAGACTVVTLLDPPPAIGPQSYPFGMAVDETHLYWASQDNYDGGGLGLVQRIPKQSGVSLEPLTAVHARPTSIAVDDRYLYWLSYLGGAPTVARVPKDQPCCVEPEVAYLGDSGSPLQSIMLVGPETLFVLGSAEMFRLSFTGVQWERSAAFPSAHFPSWSSDGEHVYWTAMDEGVFRISLDGVQRDPWIDPIGGRVDLGAGCGTLYGYSHAVGTILDFTSGSSVEVAAPGVLDVVQLSVDELFVYLTVWNAGGIYRVPRSGGMAKPIATGNIWAITVDSEAIYFGEHGEPAGAIYKVVKE